MRELTWDCETYPNCFLLGAYFPDLDKWLCFEISDWRDDTDKLVEWVHALKRNDYRMIGFNTLGFDYIILHAIVQKGLRGAKAIYDLAQAIITADNKLPFMVWPSDRLVQQVDLFKIHHFDNKARMTSLKALEFNMRMDNISDLPFPVGTYLTRDQVPTLRNYMFHDVKATHQFHGESLEQIKFREQLSIKHEKDFLNFSDVRIGKEIFQLQLEAAGISCYTYGEKGREPKQTKRSQIMLQHCIPDNVRFHSRAFNEIKNAFWYTTITGTKGQFDAGCKFGGLEFSFGTGGLHASVKDKVYESDDTFMIYDVDVKSLYPSIAIEYGYYPEHLGPKFVSVYRDVREQRFKTKKGTAENAMLKLALNGVYGASSDPFSVFYDPLFTMKITVGGQLLIAMLAERLERSIEMIELIQVNTDGITMRIPRSEKPFVDSVCRGWEGDTRLELEKVEYDLMAIADVNSYLAVDTDGNTKRKGRYEYDVEWHQDASALVVQKVAEQVLVNKLPIRETVENWPDRHDFMLRVKVPRTSKLVADMGFDYPLENTQRYYVAKNGVKLIKIMPPLPKNPTKIRRFEVNKGYKVWPCNDIKDAPMDNVDYDWYVNEIEKLLLRLR